MLPSKFVEDAKFPVRWQERDLQDYIADRLKQRGFHVETEVKANGGRADIVTSWQGGSIIEVKKYLDRNTIYQAFGQLNLYGLNNNHKLIVMGFMTVNEEDQSSAFTTASMIEQDPRVQVIFANLEEEWLPGSQMIRSWLPKFSLPRMPNFKDWRWWIGFAKTNPMLVIAFVVLLISIGKAQPQINHLQESFNNGRQQNY